MTTALSILATPRRRELLRLCWRAERSAGELWRAMDEVSFGAVSQHLGVLAGAGLVSVRRDGRRRLYRARPDALGPLAVSLEKMWDDSLERLKLRAELLESRRGPRPQRRT